MNYTIGPIQMGWCCPKCGRIYSPTQMMCLYCGGDKSNQSYTSPQGFTLAASATKTKDLITPLAFNKTPISSNCFTEGSWTSAFF